ncbi:fimbrial protein [Serratia sp. IR-2025]|uniref:fimbrial protein n=1 Tax=Serratia marcescens TaxID=615 RepID=UPI00387A724C
MMRRLFTWGIYGWLTLAGGSVALAAENMSFSGMLIEQGPCKLDGNNKAEVDFGDLQIEDIGKDSVSKIASFRWECVGGMGNKLLMVRHIGTASSFDKAAVQTNIEDFAINIKLNTNLSKNFPFIIGEASPVTDQRWGEGESASSFITLIATPVKRPGADIQPGEFSALSTLQLEYQ